MNIFLLTPVIVLGAVLLFHLFTSGSIKLADNKGVTLETVVITAVLALAAAGASIIVYNVVRSNSNKVSSNSESCTAAAPTDAAAATGLSTLPPCRA